jgi:tRNA U34 5-methylaminomethyl-2-thiouridine-forming methyltransferase MnmC
MSHPLFEIVTTTAGAISIRNKLVNEIMHNPVGPWVEANALYIDQSKLRDKLQSRTKQDLVVFDVGLGAAANALAVLHCAQSVRSQRKLHLISFEKDLSLLRFALDNAHHFDHFKGFEKILETVLQDHKWQSELISWELHAGDFLDKIVNVTAKANLICFDPYSPEVNREMWTVGAFKKLYSHCDREDSLLLTYSQSTPVRVALLAAGFYVGVGHATGLKSETTQAAAALKSLAEPLGEKWLLRWKRSSTPFPFNTSEAEQAELTEIILKHPQFKISET